MADARHSLRQRAGIQRAGQRPWIGARHRESHHQDVRTHVLEHAHHLFGGAMPDVQERDDGGAADHDAEQSQQGPATHLAQAVSRLQRSLRQRWTAHAPKHRKSTPFVAVAGFMQDTVAHMNLAREAGGQVGIMRHHHDRDRPLAIQPHEQGHDALG